MSQIFFYDASVAQAVAVACYGAPIIPLNLPKDIDIKPKLQQNKSTMNQSMHFVTSVLVAVEKIRQNPFSIYTITSYIRDKVNSGEFSILDKSPQTVGRNGSYLVEHEKVKQIFNELLGYGVITNLNCSNNGKYNEYTNKAVSTSDLKKVDKLIKDGPDTAASPSSTCAGNIPAVTPISSSPTPTTPTLPIDKNLEFEGKVQDYIAGRVGSVVTMKEIQSRFKGVHCTCKQLASIVAGIGFILDTSSPFTSKWSINLE